MAGKESNGKKAGRVIGRVLTVIFSTVAMLAVAIYSSMWIFCHGPSTAARDLFVSTMLETGSLKFVAKWYFSKDEILKITSNNSMGHIDDNVDTGLIEIPGEDETPGETDENVRQDNFDENGIELIEVSGRSYMGKVMIIKDPSKVSVATIYPWSDDNKSKYGDTLDKLVNDAGAIAGINGGEYCSDGNWGGRPKGLVVCNGQIQYNSPQYGDVMVGFNRDNILVIRDIGGMSA